MNLQGKIVLIIGAGSGIGKRTGIICASYGATIVALDINEEAAKKTEETVTKNGGKCIAIKADITNRAQVNAVMQEVIAKFGKLDVLVNNAGSTKLGKMIDLEDSVYDFIVNLNMKGPYIMSTEAAKVMMPNRKGRIINITSYCAVRAELANAPYCMAKAGVKMMTQVQALELGEYGISTVAIAPGDINTELLQAAAKKRAEVEGKTVEEVYQVYGSRVPLGRVGEPEDIAELAAFLCDDKSYFVNGSQILCTGGAIMA